MKGFVKMSRYAGMREDLVQAGGGNSSFKLDKERMVIKASGYQLAELTETEGYAIVNYQRIREAFLNCDHLDSMKEEESKSILAEAFIEGKRPSIETFLHAISGTYTLHTHPIVVNALTCRAGGMERISEIFPEALIVPYATPGVALAKAFFNAYKVKANNENQIFDVVFLQNHGLVVSAETADKVIKKTEDITRRLEAELACDYEGYHQLTELWSCFPDKIIWKVTDSNVLDAAQQLNGSWSHAFCPDCVVFLGKKMLCLPERFGKIDIENFMRDYGLPVMIYWNSNYYLVADSVKKAMETQSVMSFSAQVMLLNRNCKCNLLSEQEQNFLLNWDAEKYRRNMK
ncbi:MAG: class II aldolase/adducin family protein [Lachnospiraceae bacterium]